MLAAYKFIHKFWLLHQNLKNEILSKTSSINKKNKSNEEKFESFTNEVVHKITKNLDNFQYNVLIANYHEIYNFLSKLKINELNSSTLLKNYLKILMILNPVVPHFSSECISELQEKIDYKWPIVDEKKLHKKTNNIVIQLNGKKRGILECNVNTDEKKIIELIKSKDQYISYFKDKTIKKIIYVKGRLINLILE